LAKNKVNQIESEIVDLKNDFEHLDMIYNNLTCSFENQLDTKPCENCTFLKNQVKYHLKTCEKFIKGQANLKVVLGSQNCVFGKARLAYNIVFEKKAKKFSSFFSKCDPNNRSFIS